MRLIKFVILVIVSIFFIYISEVISLKLYKLICIETPSTFDFSFKNAIALLLPTNFILFIAFNLASLSPLIPLSIILASRFGKLREVRLKSLYSYFFKAIISVFIVLGIGITLYLVYETIIYDRSFTNRFQNFITNSTFSFWLKFHLITSIVFGLIFLPLFYLLNNAFTKRKYEITQ